MSEMAKWYNVETDGLPEQKDKTVIFVMKDHSVLSVSTKILLENSHISQVSSWTEHPGHLRGGAR